MPKVAEPKTVGNPSVRTESAALHSARENMNMNRVFVYGTLMRGFHNYERLLADHAGARFVGEAELPGHLMRDIGGVPMIEPGTGTVTGEVFEVDADTLRGLDRLEGHPHFYCRTPVTLADGSQAEAYLCSPRSGSYYADGAPIIPSGCFRTYMLAGRRWGRIA